MPVSPNSRDNNGGKKLPTPQSATNSNSSDGTVEQSKRSRRMQRQELKRKFADLRERAQLAGLIPTVPEGAVRDERSPAQPKLVERAIKEGWAVPDEIKPELVQELVAVVQDEEAADKTKVAAFRALLAADQAQHERDTPKTAKQTVNVSVQTNIAAVDVLRQSMRTVEDTTPPPPQITEE